MSVSNFGHVKPMTSQASADSSHAGALTPASPADHPISQTQQTPPRSKAPKIFGIVLTVAALGGTGWYLAHRGLESTDDAQIDADVVSVPARTAGLVVKVHFTDNQFVKAGDVLAELDPEPAKARLAQAEAALEAAKASADAADADTQTSDINARGNKSVAEASLQTASASATSTQQQIAEGEAAVQAAEVSMRQATLDRDRNKTLFEQGAISQAQFDQAQTSFDAASASLSAAKARLSTLRASVVSARSRIQEANARVQQTSDVDVIVKQSQARARAAHAQVETAKAARDLAALDLSYTTIVAPQDGIVSKRSIAVGQMVAASQPIVQLVPSNTLWVTGNFKETQISKMKPGQPAHFQIDAFPGFTIEGEVESFSAATGSKFTLLPPDNATGNFTKVVQRVPVRIKLKQAAPAGLSLLPGMSVELTVDTRK